MEIKDIVQKAHDNAVKHGFWDPPLPFGTAIALIHSELSEALEEERAGNRIRPGDPRKTVEVVADSVEFADGKDQGAGSYAADQMAAAADQQFTEVEDDDGELPF